MIEEMNRINESMEKNIAMLTKVEILLWFIISMTVFKLGLMFWG